MSKSVGAVTPRDKIKPARSNYKRNPPNLSPNSFPDLPPKHRSVVPSGPQRRVSASP